MNQLPRTASFILALMFMLAACDLRAEATPTAAPTLAATTTAIPPTSPIAQPSPTQTTIVVHAKSQPVNCRFGPGIVFDTIGGIKPNQSTRAIGRTSDNLWLYIEDPGNPGGMCWLAASAVEIDGKAESLSVVSGPFVTVTHVTVRVEPPTISVSCSAFPQVFGFIAEITTNGPTVVNWRWEVNTGDVASGETLIFERAETKTVQEFYRVNGANDYKVKLHVLEPNDIIEDAIFLALCTP